ncbi:MAG: hypothetical protein PHZ03_03805, partial [Syntrophomonas sp.]|nr:hypothetical protein [Syntrophomonas sp.]
MQNYPEQRIDSKAVPYWRWSAGIKSGFLLLIPAGYYMAQQHWHWPAFISFILLGLTLTYAIYSILFQP